MTGDKCPRGYYCPLGTGVPKGCDRGTYGPDEKMATCENCPAGFMCPMENMTEAEPCPAGTFISVNI